MKIYIYALLDPDTDEVRYVGKTKDLVTRMAAHRVFDRNAKGHKSRWVNTLILAGKTPKMLIIEECNDETWEEAEMRWIAHYRALNTRLTNIADGGHGVRKGGFKKTSAYVPGLIAKLPTISVSQEMRDSVEKISKEMDITIGDVVRSAIEQFVARYKKEAAKKKESNE